MINVYQQYMCTFYNWKTYIWKYFDPLKDEFIVS